MVVDHPTCYRTLVCLDYPVVLSVWVEASSTSQLTYAGTLHKFVSVFSFSVFQLPSPLLFWRIDSHISIRLCQAHFKLSSPKFGSSWYLSSILSHFITTYVIMSVIRRMVCRCFIRLLVIVDFQLSSLSQYNNAEIIIASDSFISCWRIYASFSRCPKYVGAFYIHTFSSSPSSLSQFIVVFKYIRGQMGFTPFHWTELFWPFQVGNRCFLCKYLFHALSWAVSSKDPHSKLQCKRNFTFFECVWGQQTWK